MLFAVASEFDIATGTVGGTPVVPTDTVTGVGSGGVHAKNEHSQSAFVTEREICV
jgi:hypothetical protein